MVNPVPGKSITTAYGKRGSHWSCRKNSAGHGIHTGVDFAAPAGTQIVAPIAGTIRHRNYGSAFGRHQFAISPGKGLPFASGEVFFAHTTTRLADGTEVKAGDKIAKVGTEGNSTGPHLHMEYMPNSKGVWNCNVQDDPKPIINWKAETVAQDVFDYKYLGKPSHSQTLTRAYTLVDLSKFMPANKGVELSLEYINVDPTFVAGESVGGAIRMRLMRDDEDASWYEDIPVLKCMLDDDGKAMFTRVYFESGELKMGTKVQMRCQGGLKSAVLSTRYRKVTTLKDRG